MRRQWNVTFSNSFRRYECEIEFKNGIQIKMPLFNIYARSPEFSRLDGKSQFDIAKNRASIEESTSFVVVTTTTPNAKASAKQLITIPHFDTIIIICGSELLHSCKLCIFKCQLGNKCFNPKTFEYILYKLLIEFSVASLALLLFSEGEKFHSEMKSCDFSIVLIQVSYIEHLRCLHLKEIHCRFIQKGILDSSPKMRSIKNNRDNVSRLFWVLIIAILLLLLLIEVGENEVDEFHK